MWVSSRACSVPAASQEHSGIFLSNVTSLTLSVPCHRLFSTTLGIRKLRHGEVAYRLGPSWNRTEQKLPRVLSSLEVWLTCLTTPPCYPTTEISVLFSWNGLSCSLDLTDWLSDKVQTLPNCQWLHWHMICGKRKENKQTKVIPMSKIPLWTAFGTWGVLASSICCLLYSDITTTAPIGGNHKGQCRDGFGHSSAWGKTPSWFAQEGTDFIEYNDSQSVSVLLHVHTCPLTVACYPSTCLQLGYRGTNSMHGSLMAVLKPVCHKW